MEDRNSPYVLDDLELVAVSLVEEPVNPEATFGFSATEGE